MSTTKTEPERVELPEVQAVGAGIYIASKAIHGSRWREWRDAGHPIVSTWIDEAEQGQTTDWSDLWHRCVSEAAGAAVTIVYREDGEELKGARVEVGAALSHGRQVLVVGDVQDSWTRHPSVTRVDNINVALSFAAIQIRDLVSFAALRSRAAAGVRDVLGRPLTVEDLAKHIHDELHSHDWTWPEHEDDTGFRGESGYVRLTPTDVRLECRDQAKRIWHFLHLGATSPEPPAPKAEGEAVAVLLEEVGYWRRDAAARMWSAQALMQAYRKQGRDDLAFAHRDALRAAVGASEEVQNRHWHAVCELCGKPLLPGEATCGGEDITCAHVRCAVEDAADDTGASDPSDAEWRSRTEEGRAALTADNEDPATPRPAATDAEVGPLSVEPGPIDDTVVKDDALYLTLCKGQALREDQRYAAGWIARLTAEVDALRHGGAGVDAGWQPIESAPRDGTPIIIAQAMTNGGWYIDTAENFYWECYGHSDDPLDQWTARESSNQVVCSNPTHWMPLPEPPTLDPRPASDLSKGGYRG